MEFPEQEWSLVGRVEFHLNGGLTKVSINTGGLQLRDFDTDKIPPDLRQIGTWLKLKLNSKTGWKIEGRAEPPPFAEQWNVGTRHSQWDS